MKNRKRLKQRAMGLKRPPPDNWTPGFFDIGKPKKGHEYSAFKWNIFLIFACLVAILLLSAL